MIAWQSAALARALVAKLEKSYRAPVVQRGVIELANQVCVVRGPDFVGSSTLNVAVLGCRQPARSLCAC